jgi:hypothetical protein
MAAEAGADGINIVNDRNINTDTGTGIERYFFIVPKIYVRGGIKVK